MRAQEEHLESFGPLPDVPAVRAGGRGVEGQIRRLSPALQLIGVVALVPSHPASVLGQKGWPGRLMGQGRGFTAPAPGVTVSTRRLAALVPLRNINHVDRVKSGFPCALETERWSSDEEPGVVLETRVTGSYFPKFHLHFYTSGILTIKQKLTPGWSRMLSRVSCLFSARVYRIIRFRWLKGT